MLDSSISRLRLVFLAVAVPLVIVLAACVTDEEETPTSTSTTDLTPTATSPSAGGSATAEASSTSEASPTADTSPTSEASPSASASPTSMASPSAGRTPTAEASPSAGATGTPSGTPGAIGPVDCDAIGDLGVPGTTLETEGSDQPTSEFAGEIGTFFEGVLDNALSDATPTCFLEVAEGDNSGLWISFSLDQPIPPDAADLVTAELIAEGVADEDVEAVSGNVFGSEFGGVTVTNHPALGQYQDTGVGLLMTMDAVVLVAGTDSQAGNP